MTIHILKGTDLPPWMIQVLDVPEWEDFAAHRRSKTDNPRSVLCCSEIRMCSSCLALEGTLSRIEGLELRRPDSSEEAEELAICWSL